MSDVASPRFTLLGTGHMGTALAGALLDAGHELTIWNRSFERTRSLMERGADRAETPAAAVSGSDLVILCFADGDTTYRVFEGAAARGLLRGKTVLQISTGGPEDALRFAAWTEAAGADLLVAFVKAYPREIGSERAEVHLAGSAEAFERYSEPLACWGRIRHAGPDVGAATARNTAGVLMMFSLMTSFLDGAAYARAHGVDDAEVEALLPVSYRLAAAAIHRAVRVSAGGIQEPEATLDVYGQALGSVVATIAEAGLRSRIGEASLELLADAIRAGLGDRDIEVLLDGPERTRSSEMVRAEVE